ncbi:ATP citrate lyase subunit 1 [Fusarium falciforme]
MFTPLMVRSSHYPTRRAYSHTTIALDIALNQPKTNLTSKAAYEPSLLPTTRTTMSYFRITLHRSAIGLPERTRGVLAALGLRRRMQTVFHPVHPQFAGMILKVKELVRVQEVDRPMSKQELKATRTPDKGFYIEKAVPRM